jgi:acetylornithine deacetylase
VRHRGVIALDTRLEGTGGHSSQADSLPSPVADLARVAVAWSDYGRARRDAGPEGFRGLCMNIARLEGGVAFNVIPREARLTASLRPPPGADQAAIIAELRALAPGLTVDTPLDNPSFATRDLAAFRPILGSRSTRRSISPSGPRRRCCRRRASTRWSSARATSASRTRR